jgi:hypothetical protein
MVLAVDECGSGELVVRVLTSESRGVPGMELYVELVRVLGGVMRRRPYLSNLAGEAVRDMNDEPVDAAEPAEPVRL